MTASNRAARKFRPWLRLCKVRFKKLHITFQKGLADSKAEKDITLTWQSDKGCDSSSSVAVKSIAGGRPAADRLCRAALPADHIPRTMLCFRQCVRLRQRAKTHASTKYYTHHRPCCASYCARIPYEAIVMNRIQSNLEQNTVEFR